jgi:hypothetical protein
MKTGLISMTNRLESRSQNRPPRALVRMRNRILLRVVGAVLVRGRNRRAADAGCGRRLPVPPVLARGDSRQPCRNFIATITDVNTTETALEAINGQSTMAMP